MAKARGITITIEIKGKRRTERFEQESIQIGKGETADLQLEAEGVSGVHALLKVGKKGVSILDLGSTNGTKVKGKKIGAETALEPGVEVVIGAAKLSVTLDAEAGDPRTQVVRERDTRNQAALADRDTRPMSQEVKVDAEDDLPPVEGDSPETSRITLELAEVERDAHGIPTFVFRDELKPSERPQPEKKVLEVLLLWREAVMSVGHYAKPQRITVGDHHLNDFRIAAEHLPSDRHPLVEADGAGFVINATDEMAFEVRGEDGQLRSLKQLLDAGSVAKDLTGPKPVYRYRIGLRDRIAVQIGELTFVLQFVSPARWTATALSRTIDFYFSKVLGISVLVHLFVILGMIFTPQMPEGLDNEFFQNPDRFANLILNPPKVDKTDKKFDLDEKLKKIELKTETDTKDKFGKVLEKKVVLAGKTGPQVDIDKREMDRKRALNAGIFNALKGSSGASASVFAGGGLGTGINNAVASLSNQAIDDAGGMGGMGSRGFGGAFGGGGLGIGGLGRGASGGGVPGGSVGLAGRGKSGYSVVPGTTEVRGGLSKDQVARVLLRAHNQVKYCYEKELNRNPNLYGKVITVFTIGPTGGVIKSSLGAGSTMNDANVEQCILRVINRLQFPQPQGGGLVDVNYPWIFKRSG